jgi:hypothetical protein
MKNGLNRERLGSDNKRGVIARNEANSALANHEPIGYAVRDGSI